MKAFNFAKYCTPAQLYLVLAGISLIAAFLQNFRVATLFVSGIFVVLWAWILNWICRSGVPTISWALVLLPIIMQLFGFFLVKDAVRGDVDVPPEADITPKAVVREGLSMYGKLTGRNLDPVIQQMQGGLSVKKVTNMANMAKNYVKDTLAK